MEEALRSTIAALTQSDLVTIAYGGLGIVAVLFLITLVLAVSRSRMRGVIGEKDRRIASLVNDKAELEKVRDRISAQARSHYDNHNVVKSAKASIALELEYWHHFAGRVLHDSSSHLAKARAYVAGLSNKDREIVIDDIDFVQAALRLAAAEDIGKMIQDARARSPPPFNALPNLRRFVGDWGTTLGAAFTYSLPENEGSMIFCGEWTHLELLLTNLFQNALKHSHPKGSPIKFLCTVKDHFAHFQMINCGESLPNSLKDAFRKTHADGRKRFGLHLMEQIVHGYGGYIKIESKRSKGNLSDLVQVSIDLPTDG